MTAFSSTTAIFLKESKGAYLSVPSETADTDTQTAQETSHGPLLSLAQDVMKTNRPQQNTCFDVHYHSTLSLSHSLFVSFPHGNQKTFSLFLLPYLSFSIPSEDIWKPDCTIQMKHFIYNRSSKQLSESPKGQTHRESKSTHHIYKNVV